MVGTLQHYEIKPIILDKTYIENYTICQQISCCMFNLYKISSHERI